VHRDGGRCTNDACGAGKYNLRASGSCSLKRAGTEVFVNLPDLKIRFAVNQSQTGGVKKKIVFFNGDGDDAVHNFTDGGWMKPDHRLLVARLAARWAILIPHLGANGGESRACRSDDLLRFGAKDLMFFPGGEGSITVPQRCGSLPFLAKSFLDTWANARQFILGKGPQRFDRFFLGVPPRLIRSGDLGCIPVEKLDVAGEYRQVRRSDHTLLEENKPFSGA